MPRRQSPLAAFWTRFARAGARQSRRLGEAAARRGVEDSARWARTAGHVLSGVVTPTAGPRPLAGGRWIEGTWGLGPLAMRYYRLFIPSGASARRPIPLLLLLHGCGQDSAALVATSRCAPIAREHGFAVLLPEQSREANPQRCWNWFGHDLKVEVETRILMAIVDHVRAVYPRVAGPLFAFGLSAGGAMALTLGLRFPRRLAAVGSHSGATPLSAANPLEAGHAMRGRRAPDLPGIARRLRGHPPPPLLLIHGDHDLVVSPRNAEHSLALWRDLQPEVGRIRERHDAIRRGSRRPVTRRDYRLDGRPVARLLQVHGLGHAWSGGAARQAFADPTGPDALRLVWQYFAGIAARPGA